MGIVSVLIGLIISWFLAPYVIYVIHSIREYLRGR